MPVPKQPAIIINMCTYILSNNKLQLNVQNILHTLTLLISYVLIVSFTNNLTNNCKVSSLSIMLSSHVKAPRIKPHFRSSQEQVLHSVSDIP